MAVCGYRRNEIQVFCESADTRHMQKSSKKTIVWLAGMVAATGVIAAGVTTGVFTAIHLFVYQPVEIHYRVYHEDCALLNARTLAFESEAAFKDAAELLRYRSGSAEYETNPLPHFLLGELHNFRGDVDKAVASYETAIRLANRDWYNQLTYRYIADDAHAALAPIYYERKDNKRSLAALQAVSDPDSHQNSAMLLALRDVLEAPERADFHFNLARQFKQDLKLVLAREELDQALRLSTDPQLHWEIKNFIRVKMPAVTEDVPSMARYYALAGNARRQESGNPREAIALYKKALREDPDFEWLHQHMALAYFDLKNYDMAEQYARQAVSLNPDFYLPLLTMGDIALEEKDYPQAVQHFKRAEAVVSELRDQTHRELLANIDNQIGFAYELMDDNANALAFYKKALAAATRHSADHDYAVSAIKRIQSTEKMRRQLYSQR